MFNRERESTDEEGVGTLVVYDLVCSWGPVRWKINYVKKFKILYTGDKRAALGPLLVREPWKIRGLGLEKGTSGSGLRAGL